MGWASMNRLWMSALLLCSSFDGAFALSFPEFSRPLNVAAEGNIGVEGYNFIGIVALSNCSGSIVRFDDSSEGDQAMILTNGHCVKMLDPGVVLTDQSSSRTFDVLDTSASRIGTLHANRLLYATMTKTDMAIYRLNETYSEIHDSFRVDPLTLSRTEAHLGSDIEVISGYWKRGFSCKAEAFVYQLKEGNWTFEDSLRYSRPGCEVMGGTSGSPVIAAGTRTVVAVNNTINESGKKCQVNNPCEVDQNGAITYAKGIGYSQQISWLYSCRNDAGAIDLNVDGCLLPRPTSTTTAH